MTYPAGNGRCTSPAFFVNKIKILSSGLHVQKFYGKLLVELNRCFPLQANIQSHGLVNNHKAY